MDRRFKLSLLGAAAFAAAQFSGAVVSSASAADLLPPPPIVQAPEIVQKSNTGWYLRGDISYDFQEIEDVTAQTSGGHTRFGSANIDDAFNLGLGLGYQITNNFRVDLTGEYVFGADFHGTTSRQICGDGFPGICSSTEESEVDKFKLLANAYVDLGHFGGFTPYVGAGIGGAYVSYDDVNSVNRCERTVVLHPGSPPCPTGAYDLTGTSVVDYAPTKLDGDNSWRFAWALHAGTAYALSDNLKLDLGYTYSRIEGGLLGVDKTNNVTIRDDGFTDHTIRAGLRYQFGGSTHH